MCNVIRFLCPTCEQTVKDRKKEILTNISDWVNSVALKNMVAIFGKEIPSGSLKSKIEWLNEFANEWDYRKKQSSDGERWTVTAEPIAEANASKIMEYVRVLGLVDIEKPIKYPDYILPLGGALFSNYNRPKKAKEIIDSMNIQSCDIVALSGTRPITDVERSSVDTYAPSAITEFEAISQGMEKVFGLNSKRYKEEHYRNENINLEWAQRTYDEKYHNNKIISLAAPSSDPNRRANSRDTFLYFLEKFNVKKGDKLLLVTSTIYVPFQLLRFMDLAIENGFYVDCVGIPIGNKNGDNISRITNYCQETKAVINAIKSISDKWL